jgi:dCMP deaminase
MPSQSFSLVAYVPVLHRGYLALFEKFRNADTLYVLDKDLLAAEPYLRKELRAIEPVEAVAAIKGLNLFKTVTTIDESGLHKLNKPTNNLILPDEDISRTVVERHLSNAKTRFYPVFLRWDRRKLQGQTADSSDEAAIDLSQTKTDQKFMTQAFELAQESPDIWRRVGAVLVRAGKPIAAGYNRPLTTDNTPWAEGDPRALFSQGGDIDMSLFMHAEAGLIAEAASRGESLRGATIYVTDFPCPPCAMLIAKSGISACRFAQGYSLLDGLRVMTEADVDVKRVEIEPKDPNPDVWVPYPSKSRM